MTELGATLFLALGILLAGALALRPRLVRHRHRSGRALAFLAVFAVPVLATVAATSSHLHHATSTEFCVSCHVMEPYGESLAIDDAEYLPAVHFQNGLVPRDKACYTCHTTYTMFGDVKAKMNGLKHVWIYYTGQTPDPIELYAPYSNRECLHCHNGSRSFEENEMHVDMLEELRGDETSCLDCHAFVHEVAEVGELEKWSEAPALGAGS